MLFQVPNILTPSHPRLPRETLPRRLPASPAFRHPFPDSFPRICTGDISLRDSLHLPWRSGGVERIKRNGVFAPDVDECLLCGWPGVGIPTTQLYLFEGAILVPSCRFRSWTNATRIFGSVRILVKQRIRCEILFLRDVDN